MIRQATTGKRQGESVMEYRARQVLDAAENVFLEHGYDGTSMILVATAAGVTKKTLYNYWRGKDELFAAVTGRLCDSLLLELHDIRDPLAAPVEEELIRFCMGIVQRVPVSPNIDVFRLAINVARRFPRLGTRLRQASLQRIDAAFKDFLDQQVAAGRLSIDDTVFAARYLVGMVTTFLFQALLGEKIRPRAEETRRYVEGAVRLFCTGYRPK